MSLSLLFSAEEPEPCASKGRSSELGEIPMVNAKIFTMRDQQRLPHRVRKMCSAHNAEHVEAEIN
jgi:hypothetical protein